jgi:hypothetical protein
LLFFELGQTMSDCLYILTILVAYKKTEKIIQKVFI